MWHKVFFILIVFATLGQTVSAQALPDAPTPNDWDAIMRRVYARTSKPLIDKSWHPPKIVDPGFIFDHLVFAAATVADCETTARAIENNPQARERNPLLGTRPGRLRLYGTNIPLAAALTLLDYSLKKTAQPFLRDRYIPHEVAGEMTIPYWRIIPLIGGSLHATAAWLNANHVN